MKTAIFVIGERTSGKTSTITALTGCSGRTHLWNVMSLGGKKIQALVVRTAIQEDSRMKNFAPEAFPEKLEEIYDVASTDYQLLICPLEIRTRKFPSFDEYLKVFMDKGFDVRIACIKKTGKGVVTNISDVVTFMTLNFLATNYVELDLFSSDEHLEARKIRDQLYP